MKTYTLKETARAVWNDTESIRVCEERARVRVDALVAMGQKRRRRRIIDAVLTGIFLAVVINVIAMLASA